MNRQDLYCLLPPKYIDVSPEAFEFITEDRTNNLCDKKIINTSELKQVNKQFFDLMNNEVYLYKDVSGTYTCFSPRTLYLLSMLQKRISKGSHQKLEFRVDDLSTVGSTRENKEEKEEESDDEEDFDEEDEEKFSEFISSFEQTSIVEEKIMKDVLEKQLLEILYPSLKITKKNYGYEEIKEKLQYTRDNKPIDYKKNIVTYRDISNREQFNLPLERYLQILFWSFNQQQQFNFSMSYYLKRIVEQRAQEVFGKDETSRTFIKKYISDTQAQSMNVVIHPFGVAMNYDFVHENGVPYVASVNFTSNNVSKNAMNLSYLSGILFNQNMNKKRGYIILHSKKHNSEDSHMTVLYYEIINRVLYFTNYDPHGTYAESSTSEKRVLEYLFPLLRQFSQRMYMANKISSAYLANASYGHVGIPHFGIQTYIKGVDPGLCSQITIFWLHTMLFYSMMTEYMIDNLEKSDKKDERIDMLRKPVSEWKIDFDIFFKTHFSKEETYTLILKFSETFYNRYLEMLYKDNPEKANEVNNVIEGMNKFSKFKEIFVLPYKVPYEEPKEEISEKRLTQLEKEYGKMRKQKIKQGKEESKSKKLDNQNTEKLIERYDVGNKIRVGYPCYRDSNCNTGCCKEDIIDNVKVCQLPMSCKKK